MKIFKKLRDWSDKRYRRYVPEKIRKFGESRGVPKPERYIP